MLKLGMEIVFIVDDNLIGNRHGIVPVLEDVVAWQRQKGYPIAFFTEASLDLSDHPDLLQLLTDANIQAVFVGIETPNAESLKETLKFQNLRQGGSIVDKVHRIQQSGMEVWTGMIVGFDHDDERIFDAQYDFLRDARVVHALMGMLHAIPKTPLYDRLLAENRLDEDDVPEYGTNVIPLGIHREVLREGYIRLMQRLNETVSFFDRADSLYLDRGFTFNRAQHRSIGVVIQSTGSNGNQAPW